MTGIVLTTPRLALREWRKGDDASVAAMQTPAVMRWLQDENMPVRRPGSVEERMRVMQAEYGHCFWVVERRNDGEFLGYCGLKRVDAEGTALTGAFEIGWSLAEQHWNHGYATEAALAVLERAFAVHDAPFVIAFTVAENVASWRVMKRIGMERRADLDFHDPAFSDALNPTIVYRIEKDQWKGAA
ncbi:MAG: GNAT family N-acetyltransferase [Sphingobium sp.]